MRSDRTRIKLLYKKMKTQSPKYYFLFISLLLVVLSLIAYEPVRRNDFVQYDDKDYIIDNYHVSEGISYESFIWAFASNHAANWHPLTWLSHMVDCELFGLNPFWHHLHNLLLHIATSLLLLWVLKRMTGAIWPSAFVAAVFALHPLHVESVAWAAERKDVLSGFFWMLTLAAYIRYVERRCLLRYLLVAVFLWLGLMAKSMLVTLPFVLLLLDYWPFERLRGKGQKGATALSLIVEKIPFFILVFISSLVTFFVQRGAGAVASIDKLPLNLRVSNAIVSYLSYVGKMFYPINLSIWYPHLEEGLSVWVVIVYFLILIGITLSVVYFLRRWRCLTVGWLWYVGTLVPVIGLVQVGKQAMADRYTYLPSIGIFIMVAWGAFDLTAKWRYRKILLGILSTVLLAILLVFTRMQSKYWQNSITLFEHADEINGNNEFINYNLGVAFLDQGDFEKAVEYSQKAVELAPGFTEAHKNLGLVFVKQGKYDKAVNCFNKAIESSPDDVKAYNNLGLVFFEQNKLDEAIKHFNKVLEISPGYAKAYNNLGLVFFKRGKYDEAIIHFNKAIENSPRLVEAYNGLGLVFIKQGKYERVVDCYKEAIRIGCNRAEMINDLAWLLATHWDVKVRDPKEAVRFAEKACELKEYKDPGMLDTLAAAYAANGQFLRAVEIAEKAFELSRLPGHKELRSQIQERLKLYRTGKSYIEDLPSDEKEIKK